MSKCYCGQVEIPLGVVMFNYGGEVHAVTACSRSVDRKSRAEESAMHELWFSVAVCDDHWHMIAGDREPVRFRDAEDVCVKCGDPASIYVRASWRR